MNSLITSEKAEIHTNSASHITKPTQKKRKAEKNTHKKKKVTQEKENRKQGGDREIA